MNPRGTRSSRESAGEQSLLCSECGEAFEGEHGLEVHKSRVHGPPTVECSNCGTEFQKQRNKIEKYDNHFCSVECNAEFRSEKVKTTCAYCGEELRRTPSELRKAENSYCDKSCAGKDRGSRSAPFQLEPRPAWRTSHGYVAVHQLVAIANGADPYNVFTDGEHHIHHKNGCRLDNRPENVEALARSEHMEKEGEKWKSIERYTQGDIIAAIAFMMNPAANLDHAE